MTKPKEKTCEELQAEIEDGKKKIRQLENREKMLRQIRKKCLSPANINCQLTVSGVHTMKTLVSCAYNMDNCCVELKFTDGSMIAIDTIAVENEVADNMYQRSELDYLIYNVPLEYADLILNGDLEKYLKAVTQYKPIDS